MLTDFIATAPFAGIAGSGAPVACPRARYAVTGPRPRLRGTGVSRGWSDPGTPAFGIGAFGIGAFGIGALGAVAPTSPPSPARLRRPDARGGVVPGTPAVAGVAARHLQPTTVTTSVTGTTLGNHSPGRPL